MSEIDEVEREIISTLREANVPLTTQNIAGKMKKHWSTVQIRCLRLQNEGKISGFRTGRINLWIYNPEKDEEAKLEMLKV